MSSEFQSDVEALGAIKAVPIILDVVCRITGMGFAAIARVTGDRWVCLAVNDKIAFGLKPGGELNVDTTLCREVRADREPVVIDDVASDEDYCRHPAPAIYGFRSYISVPIFLKDGRFFGTLCALDPKPAELNNPTVLGMFTLFADLIATQLDAGARLAESEANLLDARSASELREQFIAVLGHDLRNPLASIDAGARMLGKKYPDADAKPVLELMQRSIARMSALIDNVMDFARGRLGGGLDLTLSDEPIEPTLAQVVDELRSVNPGRRIDVEFSLRRPVRADRSRIAQLFSNLLGNALTHGAEGRPICVRAAASDREFELTVINNGEPIDPAAMEHLFAPFVRGRVRASRQGLGLGLFIAAEIARAHAGTLDVHSASDETRFTFRMPLSGPPNAG